MSKKCMILRRNVTDDVDVLKETKLLMYSIRENHGYVAKTDMLYAKQLIFGRFFLLISQSHKNILQDQIVWRLQYQKYNKLWLNCAKLGYA